MGLPHSEIHGSKPARSSPWLFAACHVLHRLLAPRHPPDALAFLHPRQPPPQSAPHEVCDFTGAPPGGARHRRTRGGGRRRRIPATTTKGRPCEERPAYPCQMTSLPTKTERPREGQRRRLADARHTHDAEEGSLLPRPADGHLITTSRCPNSKSPPFASRQTGTPGGPGPT